MMDIPLTPMGRQEIHQLETILLFSTLFRPEVMEIIKDPKERLTWVDSLAVASGALAREKAGMTVSQIAEELGRTEQTIRKHLKGETKAGKFVRETYQLIKDGKIDEIVCIAGMVESGELESKYKELLDENSKLKSEIETLKKENEELKSKYDKVINVLKNIRREIDNLEDI